MSSEEKKVNENATAEEAEKVEVNAEQVEDAVKEEKETEKYCTFSCEYHCHDFACTGTCLRC